VGEQANGAIFSFLFFFSLASAACARAHECVIISSIRLRFGIEQRLELENASFLLRSSQIPARLISCCVGPIERDSKQSEHQVCGARLFRYTQPKCLSRHALASHDIHKPDNLAFLRAARVKFAAPFALLEQDPQQRCQRVIPTSSSSLCSFLFRRRSNATCLQALACVFRSQPEHAHLSTLHICTCE